MRIPAAARAVLVAEHERLSQATKETVEYRLRVLGDECLKAGTVPLKSAADLDETLVREMHRIMGEMKGVGIAAPQVGSNWRLSIAKLNEFKGEAVVLINPTIVEHAPETKLCSMEGCLSCPADAAGRDFFRTSTFRWPWVVLDHTQFTESGEAKRHRVKLVGLDSQIIQHEIDHLDGKCMFDALPRNQRRAAERGVAKWLERHPR